MGINNLMKSAQQRDWMWTDDFKFMFYNVMNKLDTDGLPEEEFWGIHTMNIDLHQMSSNNNNVVIAGKHRFWTSMYQPITITVTFRDTHPFKLKDYFTEIWIKQQTYYYDEIRSFIKVEAKGDTVLESHHFLITDISQSQLDNNNTQVAEFSVQFIAGQWSTNEITNFGRRAI